MGKLYSANVDDSWLDSKLGTSSQQQSERLERVLADKAAMDNMNTAERKEFELNLIQELAERKREERVVKRKFDEDKRKQAVDEFNAELAEKQKKQSEVISWLKSGTSLY